MLDFYLKGFTMKYFLKSGCAAVVGLICALGFGQCSAVRADASGPYTITYKFTPGAVHKYSMTMDMTSQMATATTAKPMNIHFEMTEAQTIQSVRPSDGAATATVDMATTAALISGMGVFAAAREL